VLITLPIPVLYKDCLTQVLQQRSVDRKCYWELHVPVATPNSQQGWLHCVS